MFRDDDGDGKGGSVVICDERTILHHKFSRINMYARCMDAWADMGERRLTRADMPVSDL